MQVQAARTSSHQFPACLLLSLFAAHKGRIFAFWSFPVQLYAEFRQHIELPTLKGSNDSITKKCNN
jgi:hypothetical protein